MKLMIILSHFQINFNSILQLLKLVNKRNYNSIMRSSRKQTKRGLSLSIEKIKRPSLSTNNFQQIFNFSISKQLNIHEASLQNLNERTHGNYQRSIIRKLSAKKLKKNKSFYVQKQGNTYKESKLNILETDLILGGQKKTIINMSTVSNNLSQTFNCLKVVKQAYQTRDCDHNFYIGRANHSHPFEYVPIQNFHYQIDNMNHQNNQQFQHRILSSNARYSSIRNYHINVPYIPEQTKIIQTKTSNFPLKQQSQSKVLMDISKKNQNLVTLQLSQTKELATNDKENYCQSQNIQKDICIINVIPPIQQKQNRQAINNKNRTKRTSIFKDKLGQIQRKLDSLIVSAKNTRRQIQQKVQNQNIVF